VQPAPNAGQASLWQIFAAVVHGSDGNGKRERSTVDRQSLPSGERLDVA